MLLPIYYELLRVGACKYENSNRDILSNILGYTVLYYAILFYTVLYCTIQRQYGFSSIFIDTIVPFVYLFVFDILNLKFLEFPLV